MRPIFLVFLFLATWSANACAQQTAIQEVVKINPTTAEIRYTDGKRLTADFYSDNIVRLFRDDKGGIVRNPAANPPASILCDRPRHNAGNISVNRTDNQFVVASNTISLSFDATTSLLSITDLRNGRTVVSETKPISYGPTGYEVTLSCQPNEYFYGGGVQNGRFSHAGKKIEIVNTNSWTDGGVASPAPFYWSTSGYGVLCHTFAPGFYDFGSKDKNSVVLTHKTDYSDIFVMVDSKPEDLLQDYYQLTGKPVLLPKFAFYEGHLNAYNRDFWKESTKEKGIEFEDGKWYIESQKDNGGIKESLNGEKDNYQFSARAVVDRYAKSDMPLGWVLPNDGYGAGYGQTTTLDGNIANLKSFGDYARQHGVEIGLWTQSNLHPIDTIPALLQRDIVKEVRDAGVRVLKTDVAWVGEGYSFGLNGIADVAQIMPYYGNNARPFIISLDGWAGTQRYAGIWTGDQTGGNWEYIRFHIPTYIGAGLSGLGNITSDMDGIFGGKNPIVNMRDFEWKAFTPMQLNMDGWGSNPKYPQALGEPATSVNRNYLKLKSMILPYSYSVAYEALEGKPLIRAMFLDYPNEYTHGKATEYQYMYGPSFLVAPVYQNTAADTEGNDVRSGIWLPEGRWTDFFTGETYEGGRILNDFDAPIWKLPLFVKAGAIVPFNNANNNIHEVDSTTRSMMFWPEGHSSFMLYDDDGVSEAYKKGEYALTEITSDLTPSGKLTLTLQPVRNTKFRGMPTRQKTLLVVNATAEPKDIKAEMGGKKVSLVRTSGELQPGTWRYVEAPDLNRFSTPGTPMANVKVVKNPQIEILLPATDITTQTVKVTLGGYAYNRPATLATHSGKLSSPAAPQTKTTAYTVTPSWPHDPNADYYEISFQGQTYSTIRRDSIVFGDLQPATDYTFALRAVNKDGASDWTPFSARTASDPLENALHGLTASLTGAKDMEGFGVEHLFDFAETSDIWHTDYYTKTVPFSLTVDLHQTAQLDRMVYVPRQEGKNGMIEECAVAVSPDGKNWTPEGNYTWKTDAAKKTVSFNDKPTARYIRLDVSKAVGNFGSGSELYVMKVAGTKSVIAGDINQDGKIDANDLTSYMNYTGLKKGDPDFDGYINKGDLNGNGIIDAADISEVATQLEGGIDDAGADTVEGSVTATVNKSDFNAGDEVTITVKGNGLKAVNAIGLALPYLSQVLQFEKIEPLAVKDMSNLTNDRLHKDGTKVLYPTFVNLGQKPTIEGQTDLFSITFKALRKGRLSLSGATYMIIDRRLGTKEGKVTGMATTAVRR